MARATTGGRTPVGGGRRSCRRLLPILLSLAVLVPQSATGASDADAWMSARQLHTSHSTAIGEAAHAYASAATPRKLHKLRVMVGTAVRAMDRLEVHDCFRVWWSYVRTSYVMFDLALTGVSANDVGRFQSATAASVFLGSMADATRVDCPRSDSARSAEAARPRGGGLPMAISFDHVAG